MTRDFESVESWTAHLLRSIASRRVFIISFNVSAESQNVTISWNINMSQQLRQWAHDQLNKIIKMLIELKDQRNMTLKLNEQWINLQVEHIKRLNELKVNQTTINIQKKTIAQLRAKVLSLKKKLKEAKHSVVNDLLSRQLTELTESQTILKQQDIKSRASIKNLSWRKSFTLLNSNHHKFYKFLNSFIFIDENVESTWNSWRIKIDDKLEVNANHFHTENICIVYVISRLEDDAAKQIFAQHHHNASHSYISIYELFEYLKSIYDDQNKNWKCCHKYNALRQLNKSFNIFYFEFMKLFSYLDYENCTLMNNLQNKINIRLQDALSICSKDFITLHCLKSFLQSMNNRQWVNYQLRSERCMIIIKVIIASEKCITSLSAVTTSIIEYVKLTIFSTSESVRSFIVCYICKISDHLFKNCSQNKINTSASCVFIFRLYEIIISKNKKNKKMTFFFKNSETKN